jgi:hypothetical protein
MLYSFGVEITTKHMVLYSFGAKNVVKCTVLDGLGAKSIIKYTVLYLELASGPQHTVGGAAPNEWIKYQACRYPQCNAISPRTRWGFPGRWPGALSWPGPIGPPSVNM